MTEAIVAHKLTKAYGRRRALDGVSFDVPEGAFVSIFGPNGAGKSTLLRTLATLTKPTGGTATIHGFDIKEDPDRVRGSIGMISHRPMLYPDLTAFENLMFVARLYGIDDAEAQVRTMLAAVELDHRRFDAARTFSRGMTQRCAGRRYEKSKFDRRK